MALWERKRPWIVTELLAIGLERGQEEFECPTCGTKGVQMHCVECEKGCDCHQNCNQTCQQKALVGHRKALVGQQKHCRPSLLCKPFPSVDYTLQGLMDMAAKAAKEAKKAKAAAAAAGEEVANAAAADAAQSILASDRCQQTMNFWQEIRDYQQYHEACAAFCRLVKFHVARSQPDLVKIRQFYEVGKLVLKDMGGHVFLLGEVEPMPLVDWNRKKCVQHLTDMMLRVVMAAEQWELVYATRCTRCTRVP